MKHLCKFIPPDGSPSVYFNQIGSATVSISGCRDLSRDFWIKGN